MFADVFFVVSVVFCAGVILYLFVRRSWRRLRERAHRDILKELANKGLIKNQGEVGLTVRKVYNADIVNTFVRKMDEACKETAWNKEFHSGEVKVWFKIEDVFLSPELREDLQKAGYKIT